MRTGVVLSSILIFCATTALISSLSSCGSPGHNSSTSRAHITEAQIQHVVVIFQENRTPDNLFQDPVLISRGADIASSGVNSKGQVLPLLPIPLAVPYDLGHRHVDFVKMFDGGKMDGADFVDVGCQGTITNCAPANPQFMSVNPSEVQPYFQLAEQYTFADRMFQTNQGPSFPAHQFIIAGTSAPTATSDLFAAENPLDVQHTGCIAPPGSFVKMIDPLGSESHKLYPCFEHPTLTDLLDQRRISWKYYAPSAGSIWTGPDAIQHICQSRMQNGQLICTGRLWSNVVIPETLVLRDIATHQLAEVSWVIPDGSFSDHASISTNEGPSWVGSIVNSIGNSPYWNNTVILITWDDWGGWYDHVAPRVINSYEYGFRVPLIVVSPFAKPAYISHATHDFGSILRFIEELHGLPSLGYADALADDLSDCFDFQQNPLPFQTIRTTFDIRHFLATRRAAVDPDDD
jgi:phospholipase C